MYNLSEKITCNASASIRPSARALQSVSLIALIFFMLVTGASALSAQAGRDDAPHTHNERVISLIVRLADQAHLSQDIQFAVRAQAQAGLLIWPYDPHQARAIFSRGSRQIALSVYDPEPPSALERAEKQRLRVELLSQIARCDTEMADTLACEFALSKKPPASEHDAFAISYGVPAPVTTYGPVDDEGRELLVSVALRVAEVDGTRAMRLGQLSLEAGISPYFGRLLLLIGEADPALADRLFSYAVDYLQRAEAVSPRDVHLLSFFLVSSVGSSEKDRPTKDAIIRFLNLAFDVVMRNCTPSHPTAARNATDQAFEIYCTGKYLLKLLPRYLPDRAALLQKRLPQLDDRARSGSAIHISDAQVIEPSAIERAARNSASASERDLLYTRAAFGWLARGDMCEAERAASNISSAEMRDRVLLPVARQLISKARIKDAMPIVRLIDDRVIKTDLIVRLAQAAFSPHGAKCARTLLDLAELEAAKIKGPLGRARSLLAIAAVFSTIDPARAFAAMQEAVKSINDIPAHELRALNPERCAHCAANAQGGELFHASLAKSLAALARLDFDRTLLLSQQLTDKEASLIAQLAVCRGGLRPAGSHQR